MIVKKMSFDNKKNPVVMKLQPNNFPTPLMNHQIEGNFL